MLNNLKNIQFTTKLFVAIVIISITSVATIAGIAIKMSHEGLNQLGKSALGNTHQAVFDTIDMYDKSVRWNLEGDLRFFQKEIASKGDVELLSTSMLKQTMVNQLTQAVVTQEIPRLVIGGTYMNGSNDFVDAIAATVGTSAALLQLVDDRLLRVSITFSSDNKDTIGQLTNSLGMMVDKSKEMLEDCRRLLIDLRCSFTPITGYFHPDGYKCRCNINRCGKCIGV